MISLVDIKESHILFDGHYQLVRKIGGGGFSEVWLAHDTMADIDVALKVYTPNGELDEEGKSELKREFARLCDINHSNIIHAIGFGIYRDELPYLAMSVCRNGSAKGLIGRIDEPGLWVFIEQVASGLQYLHKRGIVHQDMKPDNVLINADGQYLIIDFGISTKTRNTLRKSARGSVGGGTPWYMSVESFGMEAQSVCARDIWAFGAMLYELMTGDVPFGQYGGVTQKAKDGKVPAISLDFSDELKRLVYDCLALNAWDRPDADEILRRVESHKAGVMPRKRWPVRQLAVAAVCALVAGGGCLVWSLAPIERADENVPVATTNKNDSAFLAKVAEASHIVGREKRIIEQEKQKESVAAINVASLCSAAEIYKQALGIEASDSALARGKVMWRPSQRVIDNTYTYMYKKGVEYSACGAVDAGRRLGRRTVKLKEYVSQPSLDKLEKSNQSITISRRRLGRRTVKLKESVSRSSSDKLETSNHPGTITHIHNIRQVSLPSSDKLETSNQPITKTHIHNIRQIREK